MTDENMREVIGGIASLLTQEMTSTLPIPLGDSSYAITHVGYLDGDPEIWLRTNADDVWILRVKRLGESTVFKGGDDEVKVVESWDRYQKLLHTSKLCVRVAVSCGVDENMALQAYCDEQLSDDERECWNRWSPGGYATKQELAIINHYRGMGR